MKNEKSTESLNLHSPKFSCYQTIAAENLEYKSENDPPVYKLFSKKCKSENKCFAVDCQVANIQNKQV